MTDDTDFSNGFRDSSVDEALDEVERAMRRFEEILRRHASASQRLRGLQIGKGRGRLASRVLLSGLAGVLAQARKGGPVLSADPQRQNRFPASSGQIFADLWGTLRQMGGRNL